MFNRRAYVILPLWRLFREPPSRPCTYVKVSRDPYPHMLSLLKAQRRRTRVIPGVKALALAARHWVDMPSSCPGLGKKERAVKFFQMICSAPKPARSTSKVLRHFPLDNISPRFLTHNTLLINSSLLEHSVLPTAAL